MYYIILYTYYIIPHYIIRSQAGFAGGSGVPVSRTPRPVRGDDYSNSNDSINNSDNNDDNNYSNNSNNNSNGTNNI